ncbi:MAG: glutathione S-transferase family protein [Sedimentitalea sp.]
MYKIYGAVASRAFRVLWALEEIGTPYELIKVGPGSDEVRAINGSGKIPVLVDGDSAMTDSTAIITYLADKHAALSHPAGTVARAQQDALMHAALDEFDALLWTAARFTRILPEEHRTEAMMPGLHWEFQRNLDRFAERLEGPCLQGETFTIADIVFVHCLNWARGFGFPAENEKIAEYAKAMRARPGFRAVRQNHPD